MKRIKIIFVLVLIFVPVTLNAIQILDLKWGEAPHNINYFTTPDGVYGISDFYVDGAEIGLLNNFNHSIDIFENGIYRYSVENIPDEAILLERHFKKTFLFTRDGIEYQVLNKSLTKIRQLHEANSISGVLYSNNLFYPVNRFEKYPFNDVLMDVIIESSHLAQIRIFFGNNISTYSYQTSDTDNIAAITPIGLINDLLVIAVEFDMGIRRIIQTINMRGDIISEILVPNRFLLNDTRDIKIYENSIYILASDRDGIKIYRFYLNGQKNFMNTMKILIMNREFWLSPP